MKNLKSLTVRSAGIDDINAIGYIAYQVWPGTYKDILSFEALHYMLQEFYSPQSLRDQMQKKAHTFLMAETEDEEPVGFASFSQIEKGIWKLHKLYVLPGFQNLHVGRSLIDCVVKECKEAGGKKLLVNVNRNNQAVTFYKKHSFTILKEENVDIGKGFVQEDYVLERSI